MELERGGEAMTNPAREDEDGRSVGVELPYDDDLDASSHTRQLGGMALEVGVLRPGARVAGGAYEIDDVLGKGGMTTVYLAHTTDDRGLAVALKVASGKNAARADVRPRMRNEAVVGAQLGTHPNLVQTIGGGVLESGMPYVATAFVRAPALADELVMMRTLPAGRAVRIARDVGRALQLMHRHGLVHRDVKPGNVLVLSDRAMLLDLGLAAPVPVAGAAGGGRDPSRVTAVFERPGTKHYMAPEQAAGAAPCVSMDVWALGATLAEMLVGEAPHGSKTEAAAVGWKLDPEAAEYRLPRGRADVPEALALLVESALVRDASKRIGLDALVEQLEAVQLDADRSDELAASGGVGGGAVLGQVTTLGEDAEHARPPELSAPTRTRASLLMEIHRRDPTVPEVKTIAEAPPRGRAKVLWFAAAAVAVAGAVIAVVLLGPDDRDGAAFAPATASAGDDGGAVGGVAGIEEAVEAAGPGVAPQSPVRVESPARPEVPTLQPAGPDASATPSAPPSAAKVSSAPKPATQAKPAAAPKGPEHASESCNSTRQAAADARDAGQHTKQLSHLAKKQCWADAREHKRELVQALVAARQFDRCIAAGRGSADPVVVRAVGQCEALRGVVPE